MNKLALAAALGATSLALAACGDSGSGTADSNNVAAAGDANGAAVAEGNAAANGAAAWSKESRIVEENGITYRVDSDGTRVALGPNESRIVVENKVRYRVDPDGSRVKIDDRGVAIDLPDVDLPDVDLPDVDAGVNAKGNPDIDVKDKKDGNSGPN
jgi:hypothetical protein